MEAVLDVAGAFQGVIEEQLEQEGDGEAAEEAARKQPESNFRSLPAFAKWRCWGLDETDVGELAARQGFVEAGLLDPGRIITIILFLELLGPLQPLDLAFDIIQNGNLGLHL